MTVTKHLTNQEAMKNISLSTKVPSMYATTVAKDLPSRANLLLTTISTQGYAGITVLKVNAAKVLPTQVISKST